MVHHPCSQDNTSVRVVRSANVRPGGVQSRAAAFVSDGGGCWRPGVSFEDARPVAPYVALQRHAATLDGRQPQQMKEAA